MRPILSAITAAALLGGCGEAAQEQKKEEAVKALLPGEYEITTTEASVRSTDNTTPATKPKPGTSARTCITDDGMMEAEPFIEAGETCTAMDNYLRGGRISLQFKCKRPGRGDLTHMVDGTFKAESLEATVTTATYFTGSGDYQLTRTVTGRRVGKCPPAEAAKAEAADEPAQ
jgi:hypothetical protein